jgi:glutamate synthase domain-containing protein 2
MIASNIAPDYIAIDGGEGGTGAAPLEFSNYVGHPGVDSLVFVHNTLVGFGLRSKVKIFTSGKITTGFDVLKRLALGADAIYSAQAMMMALGCIQALRCNSNQCPTGVATQNPNLVAGLVVSDKRKRVTNFHAGTLTSLCHMVEAMGLKHPNELRRWHILHRSAPQLVKNYHQIYPYIEEGCLLGSNIPQEYWRDMDFSNSENFHGKLKLVA